MYVFRSINEIINTISAARNLLTEMFEKEKFSTSSIQTRLPYSKMTKTD